MENCHAFKEDRSKTTFSWELFSSSNLTLFNCRVKLRKNVVGVQWPFSAEDAQPVLFVFKEIIMCAPESESIESF